MENKNIMHDCEQLRDELCAKSEMKKTQTIAWYTCDPPLWLEYGCSTLSHPDGWRLSDKIFDVLVHVDHHRTGCICLDRSKLQNFFLLLPALMWFLGFIQPAFHPWVSAIAASLSSRKTSKQL